MKRLNYYNILLGAIALTWTFTLASCSSTDNESSAEVNPTYDGQSVKTQFAINIGNGGESDATRMSAADTQSGDNGFTGMSDSWLVSLATSNSAAPTTTDETKKTNNLGAIAAGDITKGSKEYKLFYDVEIPTGTNNFLFYGLGQQGGNDHDACMKLGSIDGEVVKESKIDQTTFSLKKITEDDLTASEEILEYILNKIASVSINSHYKMENGVISTTGNAGNKTVTWSQLTPGQTLGTLYHEFIGENYTITTKNDRTKTYTSSNTYNPLAGSSVGVLGSVNTLYQKIAGLVNSTDLLLDGKENSPTNNPDKYTRGDMACAIIKTLLEMQTGSGESATKAFSTKTDEDKTLIFSWANNVFNTLFPSKLPNGAVQYQWQKTSSSDSYAFKYGVTKIGDASTTATNYIDVSNIVYPASLAYYGNTLAEATNNAITDWPKKSSVWATPGDDATYKDFWSSNGWDTEVKSSTSTVALRYPVNYGVAKLESNFLVVLNDNDLLLDKNNLGVSLPTEGLKVTGILIGGQHQQADWQFLPVSSSNQVTVYDSFSDIALTKENESVGPVYTLLFDNYNSSATSQDAVKIAVEFTNNTNNTFEGHDGIVVPNQKFYLIGELNPTSASNSSVSWSSVNADRFPGYNSTSETNTARVFIQDHTTKATFKIDGSGSNKPLGNAYVNIPDLRTTQLVLGISVDLEWLGGLQFETTIGAN